MTACRTPLHSCPRRSAQQSIEAITCSLESNKPHRSVRTRQTEFLLSGPESAWGPYPQPCRLDMHARCMYIRSATVRRARPGEREHVAQQTRPARPARRGALYTYGQVSILAAPPSWPNSLPFSKPPPRGGPVSRVCMCETYNLPFCEIQTLCLRDQLPTASGPRCVLPHTHESGAPGPRRNRAAPPCSYTLCSYILHRRRGGGGGFPQLNKARWCRGRYPTRSVYPSSSAARVSQETGYPMPLHTHKEREKKK